MTRTRKGTRSGLESVSTSKKAELPPEADSSTSGRDRSDVLTRIIGQDPIT